MVLVNVLTDVIADVVVVSSTDAGRRQRCFGGHTSSGTLIHFFFLGFGLGIGGLYLMRQRQYNSFENEQIIDFNK